MAFIKRYWPVALAWAVVSCGDGAQSSLESTVGAERVGSSGWPQWGQNAQHTGAVSNAGQNPARQLVDIVYDPFVAQEQAEQLGGLLAHYAAPIVDGHDVFMEVKTGSWVACNPPGSFAPQPCGTQAWESQIWNVRRYHWEGTNLVTNWTFASDWKPEPDAEDPFTFGLGGWEPVFHPALADDTLYVPGAGGTVFRIDRRDGTVISRVNPFGNAVTPNIFVAGPLTADDDGNIYYNAIQLDLTPDPTNGGQPAPWHKDVLNSWLVRIDHAGRSRTVTFASLVPGAPTTCNGTFSSAQLPWPPSPTAVPPTHPCGAQRPGINVSPAVGRDGTIYTVSVAHHADRYGYLVAVNHDLTPRWAASLRGHLHDGCNNDAGTFPGSLLPRNTSPDPTVTSTGGCRLGSTPGVDPATNEAPAGRVIDQSSSTPVVGPDGSVFYGAYSSYNSYRGSLFHFDRRGNFVNSYDFGWDSTPAIYARGEGDDARYSVIIKDNHYSGVGTYCGDTNWCPIIPDGPYSITQLSPASDANHHMRIEWQFHNTNTQSCHRNPDGTLACTTDHPNHFEWCINAPAVDRNGVVYANSEDGNLYTINQGGTERQHHFLNLALGAAYTPLAVGRDGLIYTENDGHLFVVGN